jgi:DNA repair protein RadC
MRGQRRSGTLSSNPGDKGSPWNSPDHASIREWPADERPREKLIRLGAGGLTDTELLAILLRTGTGRSTAVDLARSLLTALKDLPAIGRCTAPELMRLKGIGSAKAVELIAAYEIGRRVQASSGTQRIVLRSPDDVAHRMVPLLRDRRTESFVVLMLQADNSLKTEVELTHGTLNASVVHPREVFKAAIDNGAASIVVVHNHPSGNPEPSREDIEITRQLAEAGKVIGIPLHDHVIVASGGFTSLAERGLL